MTKGFKVRKVAEEKKEKRIKKWETTYKKQHELFERKDNDWIGNTRENRLHTEEGIEKDRYDGIVELSESNRFSIPMAVGRIDS